MSTTHTTRLLALLMAALLTANPAPAKQKITMIRSRPAEKLDIRIDDALYCVRKGIDFDFSTLEGTFRYVEARYDCSDFRLQPMIRLLYEEREKLPAETVARIRDVLLGFKYWMDQPGEDGMCYWSENHQILFAVSEYLAGQYFPGEVFANDGKTGAEHAQLGRERIRIWLEQRWLYGFTEWYSNTYYLEDIAPLANLIDFAQDEELVIRGSMILDLLLYDLATQSYRGTFISSSGRCYERGKKSGAGDSLRGITKDIWGTPWGYDYGTGRGMDLNFIFRRKYEVPEVIRKIGRDTSAQVIKASNGLALDELKGEGLHGTGPEQIMMQWAMEGFTNPQVIANSVEYIRRNNMLSNEFLHDFRMVDRWVLRATGLLPFVSWVLNPVSNGTAIQRANVYSYKTPHYKLSTAQNYFPGDFGDQHHIWAATLSNEVSLFTTHPAKPLSDEGALSGSPNYWVGNGRNPHAAQHENVVLTVYRIPRRKGFMEKALAHRTHAYFPSAVLDETLIDGNYAFGRYGGVCMAFIGRSPLRYREGTTDDLLQDGRDTFWVFEISTMDKEGGFRAFAERIRSNEYSYRRGRLVYRSQNRRYDLKFKGAFRVNGEVQPTEYKRFDSKYAVAERKPASITISHEGSSLLLDFYRNKREVKN